MTRQKLLCALVGFGLICSLQSRAEDTGYWRAESSTAKSITGDVAFSSEKISINFATYWIAQIRTLTPTELSAAFSADSNSPGTGNLYRLSIPADKKFLHKNTLCGSDDTQWVATYASGHTLELAFFSGSHMPVLAPEALTDSTTLCGVFSYER